MADVLDKLFVFSICVNIVFFHPQSAMSDNR